MKTLHTNSTHLYPTSKSLRLKVGQFIFIFGPNFVAVCAPNVSTWCYGVQHSLLCRRFFFHPDGLRQGRSLWRYMIQIYTLEDRWWYHLLTRCKYASGNRPPTVIAIQWGVGTINIPSLQTTSLMVNGVPHFLLPKSWMKPTQIW